MDKFMDMMLDQGLLACVGKAERGPAATQSIANHKSAYLMAVGRCLSGGPRDQGIEGRGLCRSGHGSDLRIHRRGHAGDRGRRSEGQNVHQIAPLVWKKKIADEGLLSA
jgi:fumarate hydratase class I